MKRFAAIFVLICLLASLLAISVSAAGDLSYSGYNYNAYNKSVPSPEGYEPVRMLNGIQIGCGSFANPQDIYVSDAGDIYVADTDNNRLVILDSTGKLKRILTEIKVNGVTEPLTAPTGVFESQNELYIVQSQAERVLRCSPEGEVLFAFTRPQTDILGDDVKFTPKKVLVNRSGTVFVIIENFVYGALAYSPDGQFLSFFGSNKVEVTLELLADYFWKRILSQTQINQMKRYVPMEYTNFDIDGENFIYTTTKTANRREQIRKLNTLGSNILPVYNRNMSSATGNYGDLEIGVLNSSVTSNEFVDVNVTEQGFINALDQSNGRIFQFDKESRLLHIFGGQGSGGFGFERATAFDNIGEDLVVLDATKGTLTFFTPTAYGALVNEAVTLYNNGLYSEAKEKWLEITKQNINFEMAYDGLGKACFEAKEYREAMDYFKLAYNRDGYSKAFKEYRSGLVRQWFPIVATILVIGIAALVILKKVRKQQVRVPNKTLHILTHPTDEFAELKYHKQYTYKTAAIAFLGLFLSMVFTRQITAFPFNFNNPRDINVIFIFLGMLFACIAFCVVNWCITSLLDGKGNIREIACTVSYSLLPYVSASLLSVLVSHFLIMEEGVFLQILLAAGAIWSVYLLITAFKVVHDYSVTKSVVSIVITVVGVLFLIFLCVLMFGLIQQIVSFVTTVYNEVMFR